METTNYTEITKRRSRIEVDKGNRRIEIVEESTEFINIAAAEVAKFESVSAAQAEAIAGIGQEAEAGVLGKESDEAGALVEGSDVATALEEELDAAAALAEESDGAAALEEESGTVAEHEEVVDAVGTPEEETGRTAAEEPETDEEAGTEEAECGFTGTGMGSDGTVHVIGVRFKTAGKVYYFDPGEWEVRHGSHVIVETVRGIEYGTVVGLPMDIKADKLNQPLKEVIRVATLEDMEIERRNRAREKEAYKICQEKIQAHGLEMKLINAEYTFDNGKLLFYFTADGRVDFRDLVKDLASVFRTRIELRQIGVRDETKILGGYGICGRPLCCHTWMSDFIPVSIKMAKEQNLSLNPGKISGVCGRLMCCLKNEAETYEELNRNLPKVGDEVQGNDGLSGQVESVNVLRQTVRILVDVDDEKEYHEYHVDDITVLRRRRRGGNRGHKENADSKEAQELEKLEAQERQNTRERGERQNRGDRQNRGERQDRSERANRGDRQDRGEFTDRGESPDRADRGDRQDRGNRRFNRRRNQNPQGGRQNQSGSNPGSTPTDA